MSLVIISGGSQAVTCVMRLEGESEAVAELNDVFESSLETTPASDHPEPRVLGIKAPALHVEVQREAPHVEDEVEPEDVKDTEKE